MKLFVILGNQLFPLQYVKKFRKNHLFFMSEDYELCSYEKHHKLKLLFYLSCMRSYCDELKENGFNVSYLSSDSKDFKVPFFEKLKRIMIKSKVNEIVSFEIEDKPFEKKFNLFVKKEKIIWNTIKSPMFINSRDKFNKYR